jgi:hypothetical protein
MRIRVKTLTRRTFGLDVHPSASIDELKAILTQADSHQQSFPINHLPLSALPGQQRCIPECIDQGASGRFCGPRL